MTAMLELQLPAGPEAASEARIALGDLELGMSAELLSDVRLMVSEPVTNSIRHAGVEPQVDSGAGSRLRRPRGLVSA
jgi:anti-sigma regulatory factor (Ser/Thr protein kinase)